MRYLGNKVKLLEFIESVISKHDIQGEVFADLFAGSSAVGDYFKNKYQIIANDNMHFSAILSEAKINNVRMPEFLRFRKEYGVSPFEWYSGKMYEPHHNHFVYRTYSPPGGRQYFTEENALKIDGVRLDIEDDYQNGYLSRNEYCFLLASLIESATRVSNTAGTYQAFFKFWESRALKPFVLSPIDFQECEASPGGHRFFCRDTNELVREISGDVAYIDPPYTGTQYTNSYHVLETIARYDYPDVFGKTGRRKNRTLSNYSNRKRAVLEFEDLFRQLDFEHVLVSYSNQGIIPIDELAELAGKFAVGGEVHIERQSYRTYASNNLSMKDKGEGLYEVILYFRKNRTISKSPLNYSGSKDTVLPALVKRLPKNIDVFVDAMGGAGNVAANMVATSRVVYNEINPRIFEIVDMFVRENPDELIERVNGLVAQFELSKKNKESYLRLRDEYNRAPTAMKLFTLQIYAFQNMIRLNGQGRMNTPVGNNEFNEGTARRIASFVPRTDRFELSCGSYQHLDPSGFPEGTLFYFDPPYFITKAEYNDGKRGLEGWDADSESALLDYLLSVHAAGHRFMLSNVIEHKGRTHHLLREWIDSHGFNCDVIGETGIKYPRIEVLVTNYRS